MNIALIPARGGSKRIPQKNIIDFAGKPLISYTINNILESKLFTDVYVSTDCDKTKKVAIKYGAKVIDRNINLADNYTSVLDVMYDLKNHIDLKNVNIIGMFYATAPLINKDIIIDAVNQFDKNKYDYLLPVSTFDYPILRAVTINNGVQFVDEKYRYTRSQDMPEYYHDTGTFVLANNNAILNKKELFNQQTQSYILDKKYVCDLDNFEDLEILKEKFYMLNIG